MGMRTWISAAFIQRSVRPSCSVPTAMAAMGVDAAIEFGGGVRDPWGNEKIGFSVRTEFNREDFGLTWNMVLDGGGLVASKRIRVEIDVEAVRRPV